MSINRVCYGLRFDRIVGASELIAPFTCPGLSKFKHTEFLTLMLPIVIPTLALVVRIFLIPSIGILFSERWAFKWMFVSAMIVSPIAIIAFLMSFESLDELLRGLATFSSIPLLIYTAIGVYSALRLRANLGPQPE